MVLTNSLIIEYVAGEMKTMDPPARWDYSSLGTLMHRYVKNPQAIKMVMRDEVMYIKGCPFAGNISA